MVARTPTRRGLRRTLSMRCTPRGERRSGPTCLFFAGLPVSSFSPPEAPTAEDGVADLPETRPRSAERLQRLRHRVLGADLVERFDHDALLVDHEGGAHDAHVLL